MGVWLHDQLLASQRHQTGATTGFDRHIGHGPHFVRIERRQRIGQPQAVLQIAARAIDPQPDPVHAAVLELAADQGLQRADRAWRDRTIELEHHRPPVAYERLIFDHRLDRQREPAGQLVAVGGQQLDEAKLSPFASREAAERAARHEHHVGDNRAIPLQRVEVGAQHELRAEIRFHLMQFLPSIEHRERDRLGHGLASLDNLLVDADDARLHGPAIVFVGARFADLGARGHDDLLARQRYEHAVALDRPRDVRHGLYGGQLLAR